MNGMEWVRLPAEMPPSYVDLSALEQNRTERRSRRSCGRWRWQAAEELQAFEHEICADLFIRLGDPQPARL